MAIGEDPTDDYLILAKEADTVCWHVASHGDNLSRFVAASLRHTAKTDGLTFVAHPLVTPFPWRLAAGTKATKALQTMDADRKERLRESFKAGRVRVAEKMATAATQSEWNQRMQQITTTEMWR